MNKSKGKEGGLFRTIGFTNNTLAYRALTKYLNIGSQSGSAYSFCHRCRHKRGQYSKIIGVIYISQTLMHTELTCIRVESRARKCQPRGKRNR